MATASAKWCTEPTPTFPGSISGYSMNDSSVPAVPSAVAEPEVARVGIVVVDRLAHQREAQQVAVEGRRALEVARRSR